MKATIDNTTYKSYFAIRYDDLGDYTVLRHAIQEGRIDVLDGRKFVRCQDYNSLCGYLEKEKNRENWALCYGEARDNGAKIEKVICAIPATA